MEKKSIMGTNKLLWILNRCFNWIRGIFNQKKLLRMVFEAAWVRANNHVAYEMRVSLMSLMTEYSFISGEDRIRTCGRGFKPRQPLSRRPQSTTLAPPRFSGWFCERNQAEGEGFEPPVGVNPQLFSRQPP